VVKSLLVQVWGPELKPQSPKPPPPYTHTHTHTHTHTNEFWPFQPNVFPFPSAEELDRSRIRGYWLGPKKNFFFFAGNLGEGEAVAVRC
jgi:hypothetical protein